MTDLLLVTGRFPQRSETFIYRKAVALARRGHRVTVAAREVGDWNLYPAPLPPTLKFLRLPPDDKLAAPGRAARAALALMNKALRSPLDASRLYETLPDSGSPRELARQFARHLPFAGLRPDVIHFEFSGIAVMYPHLERVCGAPIVISCRGQDIHMLPLRPAPERDRLLARLRSANAIHCVSDELRALVIAMSGRSDGVWVNRPAIDVEAIAPEPARSPGPLRIVASGRLTWVKGFEYLLQALQRLACKGVDFRAEILGDGELRTALRYQIADLGLEHLVTLRGGIRPDEAISTIKHADIFVLSSVEEGISNAVLEAMACGVPIVTTEAGGMREAVTDGVEGLLVPIRDPAALAAALGALASDPAARATYGRNARRRAVAEFSIERQIDVFEAKYSALASGR